MKKLLLSIIFLMMFFITTNVNADAKIAITKTSYENNKIIVEGTGVGEIQLVLFGLDNLPLYLTTTTAKDGKFFVTLPEIEGLTPGEYNLKASDYDGENVATGVVLIKEAINPKTVDDIVKYLIIGGLSLGAGVTSAILMKKKKKQK